MPDLDPYAIIGVPRTASREEIARAYRVLAKRFHPDAGSAASAAMTRVNEAWRILSDPVRRAQWDRTHAGVVPAHWATAPAEPTFRPAAQPAAPPSRMDSGWVAAGVVAGVALVVGLIMLAISLVTPPFDDRVRFQDSAVSFAVPPDWTVAAGDGETAADGRVVAHLTTFGVEPDELCTAFDQTCALTGEEIPAGQASIIVTERTDGTPPVIDPDGDLVISGQPAAANQRRVDDDTTVAWWQLSPPGFPDRWIEVNAEISGQDPEADEMLALINQLLATVAFEN